MALSLHGLLHGDLRPPSGVLYGCYLGFKEGRNACFVMQVTLFQRLDSDIQHLDSEVRHFDSTIHHTDSDIRHSDSSSHEFHGSSSEVRWKLWRTPPRVQVTENAHLTPQRI